MEYVSKGDLYHILHESASKEKLKDENIITWATDIACGMQYLHSLGIIHRDLKSLNILVIIILIEFFFFYYYLLVKKKGYC